MLRDILNKSWKQHSTKQQLCGHLPPISKTIQIRRTRYAGHCWRSKDELMSNVLPWTPSHGHASVGRPTRTYQQLWTDIWCRLENLPGAMDDRQGWWAARHDDAVDDIHIYLFLRTSRIWRKPNFKLSFPSPRPVVIPMLRMPVSPTSYPLLRKE